MPLPHLSLWTGRGKKSPLATFTVTCFARSEVLLVVALRLGEEQSTGLGTDWVNLDTSFHFAGIHAFHL